MISDKEIEKLIKNNKKSSEKELTEEEKIQNTIEWTTMYRRNWDLFIRDYLMIDNLCEMQNQMMAIWADNDVSVTDASRGVGKSFDIGLASLCIALLYPNCGILLTSLTIGQSNLIIQEKIDKIFCSEGTKWSSPVLCQLRKDGYISFHKSDTGDAREVWLGNGSRIYATACGEGSRGNRSCVAIIDEYVLTKKKDVDEIILPTLEKREFGGRPKDYPEETKQIFLSSSKTKTNWGWKFLVNAVNQHYKNRFIKYGFFCCDIFTAVANGIQTYKQYIQRKRDTDDLSFEQEYLNIWLSVNENSIFNLEDFEKCQVLDKPFRPRSVADILNGEEQTYNFDDDEWIRIVGNDIAVASGEENDNTVTVCMAIHKETGLRKIEYMDTLSGVNSLRQIIEIKRMFYEYKAHYYIYDNRGVGQVFYDMLTSETYDDELNVTYPAWTVNTDKDLQISTDKVVTDKLTKALDNNAVDIIIPVDGYVALNSAMHLSFRKALKDEKIQMLKDDSLMKIHYEDNIKNWISKSAEYKFNMLKPFVQTRCMINEAISLNTIWTDKGDVKLKEASRLDTKDRYMIANYCNYFADKVYSKYHKDNEANFDKEDWNWMSYCNI